MKSPSKAYHEPRSAGRHAKRAPSCRFDDASRRDKPMPLKQLIKRLAELTATAIVLPAWLAYRVGALAVGKQHAFGGWSQAMSLLAGLTGVYLRRAFYKLALPECGDGACITFGTVISHPTARIGRNVYVGAFCVLGDVTLEDDVLLGSHVSIVNGGAQHGIDRLDVPVREQPGRFARVTIGRDTWIGDRALVMADVGEHAVVAAGAVVTKPVPDFAIVVGVPAKITRYRRQPVGPEAVCAPQDEFEPGRPIVPESAIRS
jgi:acetyltransferase-like isoleucine patch superfamily enzyme